MSDKASDVAFNAAAPENERLDALSELQNAHRPTSMSDLIPMPEVMAVIERITAGYEEASMMMKGGNVIVPNPKARGRGMQSVRLDEMGIAMQGDFWEKPGALNFDSLRAMVEQTPVLNAVVLTRIRQVQRFCRIAESSTDLPGFEIRHVDRTHQVTKREKESMQALGKFMLNSGWEFNPRQRKIRGRDSFANFMAKVTRDSLTMDSVAIETEYKQNSALGLDGFYAVDGSTIRLCSERGYEGDPDIFAVQFVQGVVHTTYGYDDLIYEPRNPRSDVRACGYGLSEVELLIRVVTGFLNAMSYNIKGFDQNAIPKGMLHLSGNYTQSDIDAFKRYWNSMVKGVNNQWSLPVMVSKDQDSRAAFEKFGVEYNEMYFSKWMTFLTSMICAVFGMSPAEINFDSFTAGSTSALAGSDTAEKLAASKDSGLKPLMAHFENLFSDYILAEFGDKYLFRWTGLDPANADKKHEMRKLVLTVDEVRAEEGYDAMDSELGSAPLNPSLMGAWSQLNQMQEPEDFGQPDGGQDDDDKQAPAGGEKKLDDAEQRLKGSKAEPMAKAFAPVYVIG
jgi:hypothetical protein